MRIFKNKYGKVLLLVTTMIFTSLFRLCGCVGDYKKKITSVETMTLTIHRMRDSYVYKIANANKYTELKRYKEVFSNGKSSLELEKSVICDTQVFIELMNTCGVLYWDGFRGKHPKNVHDGTMFNFTATINDDHTIRADGSENFPKGYHKFVSELDSILAEHNRQQQ